MKHLSVVFFVAASSFGVVAHAVPADNSPSIAKKILPDASLAKYEKLMTEGRALKTAMIGAWSQSKSVEAVQTFQKAIEAAPTLPLRAVAFVEGGEVLYDLAAYPQALNAFREAIEQTLAPDFKRRALFGIAQAEFRQANMLETAKPGILKLNATKLRANYDAALKSGKFADKQMLDAWSNLAELDKIEGKNLDAARLYQKLLETTPATKAWNYYGTQAIEQLRKASVLSPKEQSEAAAIADGIYKIYLPKREEIKSNKREDYESLHKARIEYSNLLAQLGQATRALKQREEVANDSYVPLEIRADAVILIAQEQTAQKKYDDALRTLDRVTQLLETFAFRRHVERAKVFLVQDKFSAATNEYREVLNLNPLYTDQKVEAHWGMADIDGREIAVLRQKNAPDSAIKVKLIQQRSMLFMAAVQNTASAKVRHEAMLKLAAWETSQGNVEEAKKWQERAARTLRYGK